MRESDGGKRLTESASRMSPVPVEQPFVARRSRASVGCPKCKALRVIERWSRPLSGHGHHGAADDAGIIEEERGAEFGDGGESLEETTTQGMTGRFK